MSSREKKTPSHTPPLHVLDRRRVENSSVVRSRLLKEEWKIWRAEEIDIVDDGAGESRAMAPN